MKVTHIYLILSLLSITLLKMKMCVLLIFPFVISKMNSEVKIRFPPFLKKETMDTREFIFYFIFLKEKTKTNCVPRTTDTGREIWSIYCNKHTGVSA